MNGYQRRHVNRLRFPVLFRRPGKANKVAFGPKIQGKLDMPMPSKRKLDHETTENEVAPFKRIRLIQQPQPPDQSRNDSVTNLTALLERREAKFGPTHPRTIKAMVKLAGAFRIHREFVSAEKILGRAMYLQNEANFSGLAVLRILEAMVTVFVDQNKLDLAEMLCHQLLALLRSHFGIEHSESLRSQQQLEYVLKLQQSIQCSGPNLNVGNQPVLNASHCVSSLHYFENRRPQLSESDPGTVMAGTSVSETSKSTSDNRSLQCPLPDESSRELSNIGPPGSPTASSSSSDESSHGTGLITSAGSSSKSEVSKMAGRIML